MPLLPIPAADTGLSGGDLTIGEETEVLAEFPTEIRLSKSAPVRDTFVAGYSAGFLYYQVIAQRAAAQSDPMRAEGEYLLDYAEERSVVPKLGESEVDLQARLFAAPPIVTPEVIRDGIIEIIEAYSDTTPNVHYSELELDGWFVHAGTSVWDSFVGAEPNYPDRYYAELPWRHPGGAVPSNGRFRSFLIRIPVLDTLDENIAFATDSMYASSGVNSTFFVYENPLLSEELYRQIINFVDLVKGQGFSWAMVVDSELL